MAKVRITAQDQVDTVGWYDFSEIPPLDDMRYVSSYTSATGYAKISWWTQLGEVRRTSWGFRWYKDGVFQKSQTKNDSASPLTAWRNINLKTFMGEVTDRATDAGLTRLDIDYYASELRFDEGFPYIEIDYVPIPITVSSPSLNNVSLSKDKPIILSWVHGGSPQHEYEIKYIHNGIETIKKVQSNVQSHTFAIGELPEGKITYQIRLSNGFIKSEWTPEKSFTTYTFKVISLEPNSVAQNKDKTIKAEWAGNDPFTQYEFEYTQGGVIQPKITGTTTNNYVFPANFFGVETVTLRVRLHNGYVWSDWKTVTFFTYGKPATPTLTLQAEYDTATPTFTWGSVGQVSYRLQILKDEIVILDSGDVYSSSKSHKFDTFLSNNATYTARLSISNQYEYASDWTTKTFKVVFDELQTPYFDMFADDKLGRILFNIYNAEGQTDFGHCELYRREYGQEDWLRIATNLPLITTYTDYTCRSGVLYEYKARAIATNGGYTDSDIGLKRVKMRNTMLSDTANYDDYVVLIHNPKKARNFNKETHAMQYNGSRKPTFEFGDARFQTMKINFKVDEATLDKLFDLHYSNNILMLRDSRGKKIFGYISSDIDVTDADFMKYDVSFNFTETNYDEGVLV